MELRSFKDLPLWLKLSLMLGLAAGVLVFLVSMLSAVSFFNSLLRGLISFLLVSCEGIFIIVFLSKHNVDSALFGRKIRVNVRSIASLSEFSWVYRTKKESVTEEEPEIPSSLEKLLSEPTDFGRSVEELAEVAKKRPDTIAKAIKVMLEEG